jgi:hypothetical protein
MPSRTYDASAKDEERLAATMLRMAVRKGDASEVVAVHVLSASRSRCAMFVARCSGVKMESFYFRLVLQAADYLKISPRQLARAQIDDAKRTTTSYSQSKRAHTLALNGVAFVSHWPSGSPGGTTCPL